MFGEIPKKIIKICAKFDENDGKIVMFGRNFNEKSKKFDENLLKF